MDEPLKIRIKTNEKFKTMNELELSYMTPQYAFDVLFKFDKRSINPKIRYWYKLYQIDFRGESFLIGIIASAENAKNNPTYSDKKRCELIRRLCENRIKREQYWIYKNDNIKWIVNIFISMLSLAVGMVFGYMAHKCN